MVDDTTISTCSGTFYDSGGPNGNYGQNQDIVMTFCSATPDSAIYFLFAPFQSEAYYDSLIIFNGSSVSDSILGAYTGTTSPGDIISSNTSNCITFRFISDGSLNFFGWSASIGCGSTPLPPPPPPPPPPGFSNACATAIPFCSDTVYNIYADWNKVAEVGPDYDCLFTHPNPIWFSVRIEQAGGLYVRVSGSDTADVDFVCWGPFLSPNMCNSLTFANVIDCSYSLNASETIDMFNAQVSEYYMFCITSYSNASTAIQISTYSVSTATTGCDATCVMDITAAITSCNENDNTTSIKCKVWKPSHPETGQLVIKSNTGHSSIFSPPFSNNNEYEISGFTIGIPVTLTAYYTNDSTCIDSVTIPTNVSNLTAVGHGQNVLAAGDENGTGLILPEGGVAPYKYQWSQGAIAQSVYGLSEGTYYITVTDARGCQALTSIFIGYGTQTGLSDVREEVPFRTMPNPVTDELRFEFNTAIQGEGYVFGTDGKLFETFAINNQVETINISNLPSGVYVVQVKERNSNKASFTRIVKY